MPSPRVPGLGKLQGAPDAYGMSSFFAIPYAEPPVEALRWQPPKELTSWGADKCFQRMSKSSTFSTSLSDI